MKVAEILNRIAQYKQADIVWTESWRAKLAYRGRFFTIVGMNVQQSWEFYFLGWT